MSRTHKDAPYKIRKRRLGIKDGSEDCAVCAEGPVRVIRTGFTAIFFAHEVSEREAFLAIAEEGGFTVETEEVQGYLSTSTEIETTFSRYNRGKSAFDGYLDPDRAIYSHPNGKSDELIWNREGRREIPAEKERSFRRIDSTGAMDFEFMEIRPVVSHKRNIFTAISVYKESERVARHYHGRGHDRDPMSYLLSGHCHCRSCEPGEQGSRAELRAASGRLKKAFNGGDDESLEEISSELVGSNGGAYRDTMLC